MPWGYPHTPRPREGGMMGEEHATVLPVEEEGEEAEEEVAMDTINLMGMSTWYGLS